VLFVGKIGNFWEIAGSSGFLGVDCRYTVANSHIMPRVRFDRDSTEKHRQKDPIDHEKAM
jgi:hypothetical protein